MQWLVLWTQVKNCQNVRQINNTLSYFICVRSMDDLFTFNSQQFQAVCAPLAQPPHIRKRIIRTVDSKRNPSLYSLSTTSEHRHSESKLASDPKRVVFDLPADPHTLGPQACDHANITTEEMMGQSEKSPEISSKRYLAELQDKQSLDLDDGRCSRRREKIEKQIPSLLGDSVRRKERRIKSVKLSPRILLPLSDRKLPRVFKMIGDSYLPLAVGAQNSRQLREHRQIRQTVSSQRTRGLMNCGRQLERLGVFLQDEREALTQRV